MDTERCHPFGDPDSNRVESVGHVNSRRRVLLKFGAVVLLVLAVSPVTAPFSTIDLPELFGSDHSRTGGAILKSKTAPDNTPPCPSSSPALQAPNVAWEGGAVPTCSHARSYQTSPIPLRI